MTLHADALANSSSNKEYSKFWKSVNRSNNKAVNLLACTIYGCSGDNDISNRWHSQFKDVYGKINETDKIMFENQKNHRF